MVPQFPYRIPASRWVMRKCAHASRHPFVEHSWLTPQLSCSTIRTFRLALHDFERRQGPRRSKAKRMLVSACACRSRLPPGRFAFSRDTLFCSSPRLSTATRVVAGQTYSRGAGMPVRACQSGWGPRRHRAPAPALAEPINARPSESLLTHIHPIGARTNPSAPHRNDAHPY